MARDIAKAPETRDTMNILLISTYELGRQPFGLASPAAWLRSGGAAVTCVDLSREMLDEASVRAAELIGFYVPMHTATRLAVALLPAIRALNARAHLCFYGLYAPVNETYLRALGVETILGGEFEEGLRSLAERLRAKHPGAKGGAPREDGTAGAGDFTRAAEISDARSQRDGRAREICATDYARG